MSLSGGFGGRHGEQQGRHAGNAEISDESDADESFFTRLDEKSYLFDGKSHLGDFERVLGIDEETFADVKGEAETLAGLMLELKRDFPRKGDVFTSNVIR